MFIFVGYVLVLAAAGMVLHTFTKGVLVKLIPNPAISAPVSYVIGFVYGTAFTYLFFHFVMNQPG